MLHMFQTTCFSRQAAIIRSV